MQSTRSDFLNEKVTAGFDLAQDNPEYVARLLEEAAIEDAERENPEDFEYYEDSDEFDELDDLNDFEDWN